jgi:hypothetical protein
LDLGFLKMGWTELGVVGFWVWGAGELDMRVGVDGGVSMFQILALILDLPRDRGNSARTVSIMVGSTSAEL